MKAAGLNGRVARLEQVIVPPPAHQCRICGLRHVQPLTMDLVRRIDNVGRGVRPTPEQETAYATVRDRLAVVGIVLP